MRIGDIVRTLVQVKL